jgi:hypothetical protein
MATENSARAEAQRIMSLLEAPETATAPAQAPEMPAAQTDARAEASRIMSRLTEDRPAVSQPRAPSPAVPVTKPTMYQQARTAPKKPEPELTWSETGQQAIRNLPSSTVGVVKATAQALNPLNLPETLGGIKEIGRGLLSKTKGVVGVQQDPAQAAKDEAVLDAVAAHYKQAYGSEAGFKRALANDPASVLADMATLITGGAGAATKTGLISQKAALKASQVAGYVDPIQAAVKVAKAPLVGAKIPFTEKRIPGVANMAPYALALTTGRSPELIEQAARAGLEGTEAQRNAFLQYSAAGANDMDIVDAAEDALSKAKKARSDAYKARMTSLGAAPPDVDYAPILQKLDKLKDDYSIKSSTGVRLPKNKQAIDLIEAIESEMAPYAKGPAGSAERNIFGADALKQRINEMMLASKGNPGAYRAGVDAYNTMKDAIMKVSPEYGSIMREYEDASGLINDIRNSLGVGRAGPETVLKRLLPKKQPSTRKLLIEKLGEYDDKLPHMIAGAALREAIPGGIQNLISTVVGFGVHPVGGVANILASSPKLAGRAAYTAGRLGAGARAVTQPAVTLPAYQIGRATEVAGQAPMAEVPAEEAQGETPTGVTPDVVERIREVEGEGKNPMSSASGPFQIVNRTFIDAFRKFYADQAQGMTDEEILDLKNSPDGQRIAEEIGPMLIQDNANIIGRAGYETTPGNVYLAHFLGATDALKVLNADPSTPVDQFLPAKVISSNERLLRGKTAGEVREMMEQMMQPAAASGGRIERRAGGRVDHVDGLVEQLMLQVRKAKKETTKSTEPLLNQPDEHIVRALDVAQQAI